MRISTYQNTFLNFYCDREAYKLYFNIPKYKLYFYYIDRELYTRHAITYIITPSVPINLNALPEPKNKKSIFDMLFSKFLYTKFKNVANEGEGVVYYYFFLCVAICEK